MVDPDAFVWFHGKIGALSTDVRIEILKWLFQDRFSDDNESRIEKNLMSEVTKKDGS